MNHQCRLSAALHDMGRGLKRIFNNDIETCTEYGMPLTVDRCFLSGSSTVSKSLQSGEVCIVVNYDYCLSGNTQDLKQLKNHIDVILDFMFENQVSLIGETNGYGRVIQEASDQ
jgi:hypothetical protein